MAQDQEKEDSVYDFLYIDSKRIALFLSQFDDYGHLKALTKSTSENTKTGGGIDIKLFKADLTEGEESSLKKEYDAQWVAPLLFLDQAGKRGLIERDISKARIGRLVLLSGSLAVFDLGMMKAAWELPFIKKLVHQNSSGNLPITRQQRKGNAPPPVMPPEFEMMFGLLGLWPHVTQVTITGDSTAWGTIRDDGLIASVGDLTLKHGTAIAGSWAMLGVLDAMPDTAAPVDPQQVVQQALAMTVGNSLVGTLVEAMAPLAKQMLGRPSGAHGVTPLLIFRDITGFKSA